MRARGTNRRARTMGRAILWALATFAPACVQAQTEPVFSTGTEMVLVPATVLDKHGLPVSGLTRDNFELRVDGRLVTIAGFNEVSGQVHAPASAHSLPPDILTNVPPGDVAQRSWVVLLPDFINTAPADRMQLRRQLLKFLAKDLRPGQQIAIYALSSSLALLHPFTSDTRPLIEAASQLMDEKELPPAAAAAGLGSVAPAAVAGTITPSPGGLASVQPRDGGKGSSVDSGKANDIEDLLLQSQWRMAVYDARTRAESTLAEFRQLAGSFAGVAGKKTVLWLTGDASPLNPTLLNPTLLTEPSMEPLRVHWRDIAATYEALSGAGISLFPVDIRGVTNPGLKNPSETPNNADFTQTAAQAQPGADSPYSSSIAQREGEAGNSVMAMQTAAVETGGQLLRGSNDLSALLARAQNFWSSYYVLAFKPEPQKKGKSPVYHRIEVRVPGRTAQVLYRHGYLATPESVIDSKDEVHRDLSDASNSPIDFTAIPLTLRLSPEDKRGSLKDTQFVLAIPSAALEREDTRQGSHYSFSIYIVLKNADGKVLSQLGDKIDRVFAPKEAAGIARHGFLYPGRFDAPAGKKSFARIIIRDNESGRVGTITVQIARN